jgi:hypothetical protein
MKQLAIRIERRTLHLAETETRGDSIEIRSVRSFPLPENMENGACENDPEALAKFTVEMIKRGRLTLAPAILLFNSEIAVHHEYYHQRMSSSEMYARARAEAESFLIPDFGAYISECERYNPKYNSDDRTSAVFAVKDGFLRAFVKSLKTLGVKCLFASSCLSVSSDLARKLLNSLLKNDVRLGRSPICLDVGEDCLRFLFFVDARLSHRRETPVPEGFSDEELLIFIEEETKKLIRHVGNRENDANIKPDCILLAGERATAPDFADCVAGRLNTPCRRWDAYTEQIYKTLAFGGELTEREALYIRAVSSAGAVPKKQKKKNLLYGGFRKRREQKIARAIALFFTLAALAAMSAMPAANWHIERQNADDLSVVTREVYAEAREKLAAQRQLNALLQSHMAEEAYMQNRNLKYGALLYQISRGMLANARIEGIEHENNSNSMDITFTTEDIDYFLEAKDKMNSDGNLTVDDKITMDRLDSSLWRCTIKISWDIPAMGGTAE